MKKLMLLSLSAAVLAGCAFSDPSALLAQRQAVMCTGCNSVWVAPDSPNGKPGMFPMGSVHRHRACPYCTQMAQKFFSSGQQPAGACPKCGKSMRACLVELRPAPSKKSS